MNKDILLRVSVLEEVWDAPAFAVVRLDQTLARHYIELIQQAQELGQQYRVFDALSLFDYTPVWYEYIEALDRLLPGDGRKWAILAPRQLAFLNFPRCQAKLVQQDATTVQVCSDEISWHSYLKHSTVGMETAAIPLGGLYQVAYPTPRDLALAVEPLEAAVALQEAGWLTERELAAIDRLGTALTPVYERLTAAREFDLAHAASTLRSAIEQADATAYLAQCLRAGPTGDSLAAALAHVAIAFHGIERPWHVADNPDGAYTDVIQEWQGWLRQILTGPLLEYMGPAWPNESPETTRGSIPTT